LRRKEQVEVGGEGGREEWKGGDRVVVSLAFVMCIMDLIIA
jgi:hypothetical protein